MSTHTSASPSCTGPLDSGSPGAKTLLFFKPEGGLALYKFVIHHLPIAVVAIDSAFRIIDFNPWAERITQISSEEAVGRHCWEVLQSDLCGKDCPLRTVLDQVNTTITSRTNIRDRKGRVIHVQFSIAALRCGGEAHRRGGGGHGHLATGGHAARESQPDLHARP